MAVKCQRCIERSTLAGAVRLCPLHMRKSMEEIRRLRGFVMHATQDGWTMTPTFHPIESVERAATLKRDGFTMQVIMREPEVGANVNPMASINVWGPDSMCIRPPDTYSWEAIKQGMRACMYCNATDVDVARVGFAGRSCMNCLPEQRKKQEFPGWTS